MPFNQKLQKFNAKINTVTIGSGDKTVTIGGDSTYPFYSFDAPSENTPKIGVEISDMGLENVVSEGIKAYYDGASTIGEMAKKAAAMEGADFVALILEGGDPNGVNKLFFCVTSFSYVLLRLRLLSAFARTAFQVQITISNVWTVRI